MDIHQTLRDLVCPAPLKRERRKESRPRELLQAALTLFVEKGFAATKAEEVARLAGVSKGTLFLYFASKEELFKAVVRENISGQFSEFNAAIDAFTGSTGDLLRTFMNAWWERAEARHSTGITKLILSEGPQFPELAAFYRTEVLGPAHQLIARVLERGVQRQEFRALEPRYGVYTVLAPILFLTLWKNSPSLAGETDAPLDVRTYLNTQIDALLNGLSIKP